MDNNVSPPRVLIIPFPIQGHINTILKMAQLLSTTGVHVTFVITDYVHDRLLRHGSGAAQNYPSFEFRTFPDGLPDDHSRSRLGLMEFISAINSALDRSLKQILLASEEAATCIIADSFLNDFILDFGDEVQIPVILFRTASAAAFWVIFSVPDIIQAGELPTIGDEDQDSVITGVAGMETLLRCRDLPTWDTDLLPFMAQISGKCTRAAGLILNTFEDLEGSILSHIKARCNPKIYTVGPLHSHLKERLLSISTDSRGLVDSSLFPVDRACMEWLDAQATNSVVYVSFGSLAVITKDQLVELCYGLVNSNKRFLWVVRPDSLADGGRVPRELLDLTRERGFLAEWVPQEEVLSHPSVGGFLTHSGWNSTLESVVAGVPMICWPSFGDQLVNSRFVGEVWKLGIDMKGVCDRTIVEKMVNDLMVERRDEFARSTTEMARLAKKSVSEDGTSYSDLNSLVEDIKLMMKK